MQEMRFVPADKPGFHVLTNPPFSDKFKEAIKAIPGVAGNWNGKPRGWLVPTDAIELVNAELDAVGYAPAPITRRPWTRAKLSIDAGHDYQRLAASAAVAVNGRLISFEMGLGKTLTALAAVSTRSGPGLIVCPAQVCEVWRAQIDLWWPEAASRVVVIEPGKKRPDIIPADAITICSYNMVKKVAGVATVSEDKDEEKGWAPNSYSWIIADESHRLRRRKTAWTAAMHSLAKANVPAMKLALTGTPIANEPADVWGQWEFVFPGGAGPYWKFVKRYSIVEPGNFDNMQVYGLNVGYTEEFRHRLAAISSRVVKADVAHLLPPIFAQRVPFAGDRYKFVRDYVENLNDSGVKHVLVACYHHEEQAAIASQLESPLLINGEMPPAQRLEWLAALAGGPGGTAVVTMASCGTGVDLSAFQHVVVAETYTSPDIMAQFLGRFNRLSSTGAAHFHVLEQKGSADEVRGRELVRKLNDAGTILKKGNTETALSGALTHSATLAELSAVFSNGAEENDDGYDDAVAY